MYADTYNGPLIVYPHIVCSSRCQMCPSLRNYVYTGSYKPTRTTLFPNNRAYGMYICTYVHLYVFIYVCASDIHMYECLGVGVGARINSKASFKMNK